MNTLLGHHPELVQSQYRGHRLTSHFQPIIAVAHMRAAAAEALLRADESTDARISPREMFTKAAMFGEGGELDQAAHETHLTSFQEFKNESRWLFLNCRPEMVLPDENGRSPIESAVARFGYRPSQIVISIAEHSDLYNRALVRALSVHQQRGFLVAIDNFGNGSSNFDRILSVRPDFVKLNRSLVHRASLSRDDRRVVKMLVSMLHRMGAMVVAESVETAEEALAVMDADVDLVQGYYFARPSADLREVIPSSEERLKVLWPRLAKLTHQVSAEEAAQISAVRSMMKLAVRELESGGTIETASKLFFAAPNTLSCFILDENGVQRAGQSAGEVKGQVTPLPRTTPLFFDSRANWSCRRYFKDAIAKPGQLAIHGPHRSLLEGPFVYTAAMTASTRDGLMVLVGNFRLEPIEIAIEDVGGH